MGNFNSLHVENYIESLWMLRCIIFASFQRHYRKIRANFQNELFDRSYFDFKLDHSLWLVSNFIPMDSKKFEFRNFDWIIRFAIKNESEIEKFRSRDQWIVGKNRFWENEILTHNYVNTVSDKRYWTGPSDSECDLVPLIEVWWCRDYVIWRN